MVQVFIRNSVRSDVLDAPRDLVRKLLCPIRHERENGQTIEVFDRLRDDGQALVVRTGHVPRLVAGLEREGIDYCVLDVRVPYDQPLTPAEGSHSGLIAEVFRSSLGILEYDKLDEVAGFLTALVEASNQPEFVVIGANILPLEQLSRRLRASGVDAHFFERPPSEDLPVVSLTTVGQASWGINVGAVFFLDVDSVAKPAMEKLFHVETLHRTRMFGFRQIGRKRSHQDQLLHEGLVGPVLTSAPCMPNVKVHRASSRNFTGELPDVMHDRRRNRFLCEYAMSLTGQDALPRETLDVPDEFFTPNVRVLVESPCHAKAIREHQKGEEWPIFTESNMDFVPGPAFVTSLAAMDNPELLRGSYTLEPATCLLASANLPETLPAWTTPLHVIDLDDGTMQRQRTYRDKQHRKFKNIELERLMMDSRFSIINNENGG